MHTIKIFGSIPYFKFGTVVITALNCLTRGYVGARGTMYH